MLLVFTNNKPVLEHVSYKLLQNLLGYSIVVYKQQKDLNTSKL